MNEKDNKIDDLQFAPVNEEESSIDNEDTGDLENSANDYEVQINDENYEDISDSYNSTVKDNSLPYVDNTNIGDYNSDKFDKKKIREHRKRNRIKAVKNKRVFRLVWIAMVLTVGFSLASYLITGSNDFFGVGRPLGKSTVVVPDNVTVNELSTILNDAGVIDAPEFFEIYCSITANMDYFQEGTFEVETNLDYEELINYLQSSASKVSVSIMFREGLTVMEVAEMLEKNNVCEADEFLEYLNSEVFDKYDMIGLIDNADDKYYKLEGYLFPNTYNFYLQENIESVVGKMLFSFQEQISETLLEDINNSGYTMDEIIVMASIIQTEAANEDDMKSVSAVIHNRLENGASQDIYTLGLESTYFYPYRMTSSNLPSGYVSEYETDTKSGLPAGAICNPGLAAIEAAVHPNTNYSDMFYFCHDSDGKPYYAKNYNEHLANLEKAGIS